MPLHYGTGFEELKTHMVRPEKVNTLMTAANRGMKSATADTTSDEVFTAYLTLARNAVEVALDTRRDNRDIQSALMSMLLLTDSPRKVH